MLRLDNATGVIAIDDNVVSNLVSIIAGNCFGISGMTAKNVTEEFWELFRRDQSDKGISVRCVNNVIEVDLHIMVIYGINIPAITESISHKVAYTLEELTGFKVGNVNIYVDSVTK